MLMIEHVVNCDYINGRYYMAGPMMTVCGIACVDLDRGTLSFVTRGEVVTNQLAGRGWYDSSCINSPVYAKKNGRLTLKGRKNRRMIGLVVDNADGAGYARITLQ